MDKAVYKLEMLNESIKALKEWGDKMVIYELGIYDELNWNNILINFDLFSLNFVFFIVDAFSETPRESLDNGGS